MCACACVSFVLSVSLCVSLFIFTTISYCLFASLFWKERERLWSCGVGEVLEGVVRWDILIRIYCMKIINYKKERETELKRKNPTPNFPSSPCVLLFPLDY